MMEVREEKVPKKKGIYKNKKIWVEEKVGGNRLKVKRERNLQFKECEKDIQKYFLFTCGAIRAA